MEIQRSQKWSVFNAVFHDGRFHKEEPNRGSEESITLEGFNFVNIFYNNFVRPYSSRFSMFAKMSINFCGYTRYIIPGQEDSTLNQEPWSPAQQNSPGCFRV